MFRFCRRARFSPTAALKLLHATVRWRLTSSLQYLTPASVHPLYLTKPLFFFHPDLVDRFGRPCAVLNLRHVQRTDDGTLDALKDYARLGWEVGRRYLTDLSRQGQEGADPKLQIVVIVDLEGAGMSNLVRLARPVPAHCALSEHADVARAAGNGAPALLPRPAQVALPRHGRCQCVPLPSW